MAVCLSASVTFLFSCVDKFEYNVSFLIAFKAKYGFHVYCRNVLIGLEKMYM